MKKLFLLLILSILLTGCGEALSNKDNVQAQPPQMPKVDLSFEKKPLPVNRETTIQATVTQGGEPVTKADYVEFEIWNTSKGKESSQTIETENVGNGVYQISYNFSTAGIYKIIAHTQVGDLHTMPQEEITVGDAEKQKTAAAPQASQHSHSSKDSHAHEQGKSMVQLKNKEAFQSGEKTKLTSYINRMEQPFENGVIRFEIYSNQMKAHQYIDAKEVSPGEYTAFYTFPDPGTYTINVHYEKPDKEIHGHENIKIEVS